MKMSLAQRKNHEIGIWASCIFLLLCINLCQGRNLIPNPGFEQADPTHSDDPAGWMRESWGNAVTFKRSQDVHSGRFSAIVNGDNPSRTVAVTLSSEELGDSQSLQTRGMSLSS